MKIVYLVGFIILWMDSSLILEFFITTLRVINKTEYDKAGKWKWLLFIAHMIAGPFILLRLKDIE